MAFILLPCFYNFLSLIRNFVDSDSTLFCLHLKESIINRLGLGLDLKVTIEFDCKCQQVHNFKNYIIKTFPTFHYSNSNQNFYNSLKKILITKAKLFVQ